ncbi:hypothetical protein PTKIN_Ptkin04bG0223100 [Pterospermum kingtungense]
METEVVQTKGFGGSFSLPVENVQALATKNLEDIPSRYIRPEMEFDVVSIDESLEIPVIDMSKLEHDDEQEKLHLACKDWGFFQKLDWGDMLFLIPRPVPQRNMRFWPTTPSPFRETFDKYSMELHKVAIHLLSPKGKNLGTDPERLRSFFEDGTQGIRMNYYPPCAQANKVFGLAPHSDATGLTLLLQVNEIVGLQIKKIGKWVPVKPVPGAIIINIGDMIEIMSNGEYKSIERRAVVNPDKERLSIAAFHHPNRSTEIGPLPDLVKANEAKYRTIPLEEFLRLKLSSKLNG